MPKCRIQLQNWWIELRNWQILLKMDKIQLQKQRTLLHKANKFNCKNLWYNNTYIFYTIYTMLNIHRTVKDIFQVQYSTTNFWLLVSPLQIAT